MSSLDRRRAYRKKGAASRKILIVAVVSLPLVAVTAPRHAPSPPPPPTLQSVQNDFARAYARTLLLISLTSDELIQGSAGNVEVQEYDLGNIGDPATALLSEAYWGLRKAVDNATALRIQLTAEKVNLVATACDLATATTYESLGYLLAAEWFDEWYVGSELLSGSAMNELFSRAIERVDAARSQEAGCGALAHLQHALRARANRALGNWSGAAADAASVPTGFSWQVAVPNEESDLQEKLASGVVEFGPAYSASASGDVGLLDQESGSIHPLVSGLRADLMMGSNPALTVVSGREMRLIEAEAGLLNNDFVGAIGKVHELRALDALSTVGGVPTTFDEVQAILTEARRANLFLQGRRLADAYQVLFTVPEWSGTSDAAVNPGTFLPIAVSAPCTAGSCEDMFTVTNETNPRPLIVFRGKRQTDVVECFEGALSVEEAGSALTTFNVLPPGPHCLSQASLFASDQRMVLDPAVAGWTGNLGDVIPEDTDDPYLVPLMIWKPDTHPLTPTDDDIGDDVDLASGIFLDSRVGIEFLTKISPSSDDVFDDQVDCSRYDDLTNAYLDGVLNVYYVDSILNDARGLNCAHDTDEDGRIILISIKHGWGSTLAHELGHAHLRMFDQAWWHTNEGAMLWLNFPSNNLMASFGTGLTIENPRDTLTLGQAFRANVHELSWLNIAQQVNDPVTFVPTGVPVRSAVTRYCPCRPLGFSPCLPIRLSASSGLLQLENPTIPTGITVGSTCGDQVHFLTPSTPEPQDAVLLLDGQERGSSACGNDLLRESDPTSAAHRFQYHDLLDPTATGPQCRAETVLFSRTRRLDVRSYVAGHFDVPLGPGEGSVLTYPLGTLSLPVAPPVSVRYTDRPTQLTIWSTNRDNVDALFNDNRVGVAMDWNPATASFDWADLGADPCEPVAEFTQGALNIYWVHGSHADAVIPSGREGIVCGDDNDVVFVRSDGAASDTELAHQLGHAFGLAGLNLVHQVDFLGDSLEENVMYEGALADPSTRARFTLGQVFRMYFLSDSFLFKHLGTGPGTDRCAAGAAPNCPELWLDVAR